MTREVVIARTKARLGKLPGALDVAADVAAAVSAQGFMGLDITLVHAQRAGRLPGPHRDPFDRMLVAQSQLEDVPIVSDEGAFDITPRSSTPGGA